MDYLIDSHCHLHDREFFTDEQAEEMLIRAKSNNVTKIICIGTNHQDSLAASDFAQKHDNIFWTYGIHPEATSSKDFVLPSNPLENLNTQKLCAIGEVGLDYHYDGYNREKQIKLFEQMIQLAIEHDLPLSFHIREAFDDFFPVIKNFPNIKGVVHSFSDNKKNLKRILNETNFLIGVNGLATYSTLPTPPLERIILETDAPFLTPSPFRGIINEPGYVRNIATWLGSKLGENLEIIEQETTNNAERLFHI